MCDRRPNTLAFIVAATALACAGGVHAATIQVNIATDDPAASPCSLRDAISAANTDTAVGGCDAGSGNDEITFHPDLAGETITLINTGAGEDDNDSGDLDVNDPEGDALTITGPVDDDAASIIIDGNEADRVFHAHTELTLRNMTIQNGLVETLGPDPEGGGILTESGAPLELRSCVIRGNKVQSSASGGGGGVLTVESPLRMSRCVVRGNEVVIDGVGTAEGGGILVDGPTFITSSRITGNLVRVLGSGNAVGGGAYFLQNIDISAAEFSNNTARSASGSAAAGGLMAEEIVTGSEELSSIVNSTFSKNNVQSESASALGAGLVVDHEEGGVRFASNTVSQNTVTGSPGEGGGFVVSGGGITLAHNLVASNRAADAPDCLLDIESGGRFGTGGHNLIGDSTGCDFYGVTSDQVGTAASGPIDPMLAPLAFNGGPTRTHGLQEGSPAIDRGNSDAAPGSGFPACPEHDQRGESRPADGDGSGTAECDIGAFEVANASSDSGGGGGGGVSVLWLLVAAGGLGLLRRRQAMR